MWGAFPIKHSLGAATQARKRPILSLSQASQILEGFVEAIMFPQL